MNNNSYYKNFTIGFGSFIIIIATMWLILMTLMEFGVIVVVATILVVIACAFAKSYADDRTKN